jgi:hypothetical protein
MGGGEQERERERERAGGAYKSPRVFGSSTSTSNARAPNKLFSTDPPGRGAQFKGFTSKKYQC